MTEISGEYLMFSWLAFFLPFFRQRQRHCSGRASPPDHRPGLWPSLTNHSCLGPCSGIRILTKAGILPWDAKHRGWIRGSLSSRDLHTWRGLHIAVVCCHASALLWSCGGNQAITGEAETTAQKQNQDRAIWSISGVLDIYSHHGFPSHVTQYMLRLAWVVLDTCYQETSSY